MKLQSVVKVDYISLFFMTVFTLWSIVNNEISVFYIIYLFWFHEFLRTIIKVAFYVFKKDKIAHQRAYWSTLKSKLFVLFIYFVFIIIFFGLMLDWKNSDLIFINLEVFMLKNTMFNLTSAIFLVRELLLYYKDELLKFNGNIFLSRGVIILHISILLGMCIWAFLPKTMYENTHSNIVSGIVIAPFLLLKLYFEINEVRANL
ncbi:hypothetical protein [Polaribacter sp.]|uniref:hypothetical protein n=1 Tax=Polaribacter sp. TaxID=1920175 RepID=UPI003EF3BD26